MNINNSINQYNNFINNGVTSNTSAMSNDDTVAALKEGQVFEGSITSMDAYGRVVIGLANGESLSARLDQGVSIIQGQSLFFEVKSNDGNLIQIKPVSYNVNTNPTLIKALDLAGISATDKSINMVNHMMEESMNISSESLLNMNRILLSNPNIDPKTAILMTKFDLPVTTENANMFEAYSNDRAQIMSDVSNISNSISNLLTDSSLSKSDIIFINNQINTIFNDYSFNQSFVSSSPINEALESQVINNTNLVNEDSILEVQNNRNDSSESENFTNIINQDFINEQTNEILNSKSNNHYVDINDNNILHTALNNKELASLNTLFEELNNFKMANKEIFSDSLELKSDVSTNQIMTAINKYISTELSDETIKNIFSNKGVKAVIQNVINNEFSIVPKELEEPGKLNELYKKILTKTAQLAELADGYKTKAGTELKETINNLRDNVSFMNSANDIYNFVQIPLKMFNQNTDSMLYVKQNKKKAYENGEEITCYLHFDMEKLGSTDIYIKMKQRDVKCDWFLEDIVSMELIEQNLDLLNTRLQAKGYNINNNISGGKKTAHFVNDFLRGSESVSSGMVHRYSFDVRA